MRLKPKAPATGYVDGAWWPRSDDLLLELPDLLAVLSTRLGSIERVIYNLGDWALGPKECRSGDNLVPLGGYSGQPVDTIQVVGADARKVILLVIPSATAPDHAYTSMMSAATAGNSSTSEDLLRDLIENGG